jgi:effector-binding domain-containing protein
MSTEDVVLKPVDALRVAELTATAAGYGPEQIAPVIGPLYQELFSRLDALGVTPVGPPIGYYEPEPGEHADRVTVHAGAPVRLGPLPHPDVTVVDLPALPAAATVVHHGPMDDVMHSLQILARWIEDNGYRPFGYHREVYLDYHPQRPQEGVTELQVAVVRD